MTSTAKAVRVSIIEHDNDRGGPRPPNICLVEIRVGNYKFIPNAWTPNSHGGYMSREDALAMAQEVALALGVEPPEA